MCDNQLTVVEVVVVIVVVFVAEGSVAEVVVLYGVSLIKLRYRTIQRRLTRILNLF